MRQMIHLIHQGSGELVQSCVPVLYGCRLRFGANNPRVTTLLVLNDVKMHFDTKRED